MPPNSTLLPLSIYPPRIIEGLQTSSPVSQHPHEIMVLSAVPQGRSMEVTVPTTLSVLNGSDTRLPCTFNSCYTVNHKQFSLNWTYQECSNCSEEMVSPSGGGSGGKQEPRKHEAQHSHPYVCPRPGPQRTLGRMSDTEGMMSPHLNPLSSWESDVSL